MRKQSWSTTRAATDPSPTRHIPALDGLRGIAVIAVIAFHAGHLTGGYLGVDLFFVLSGFLITSLLLAEHQRSGAIALGAFWVRRARRLLPAVLLLLVVVAIVARLTSRPTEIENLRLDGFATLVYVANWQSIAAGQSYWSQYLAPSPLSHTWSLAIEEQFYVVWPLVAVVVLGHRDRRRPNGAAWLLAVALVGAIASATLMIVRYRPEADLSRLYLGTDTRAAGILLGAALACIAVVFGTVRGRGGRRALEVAGWLAAFGLLVAWLMLDGQSPYLYRGGLLLCGVACVIVIAAVSHPEPGLLARALAFAPLRGAGIISYGLYLWHWPIFTWLNPIRMGFDGWTLLALQLVATLAIALFSFYVVEMPVRRGRITAPTLRRIAPLAILGVIVILLVATIPPAPAHTVEEAAAAIPALGPLGPKVTGGTASGARRPRVLIVGDSVGESLATAIVPNQSRFEIEARSLARTGCGIMRDNPDIRWPDGTVAKESACAGVQDEWRKVGAELRPDAAVLVLGWPGSTERFVAGDWRRPCDRLYDQWYAGEVRAGLEALASSGARVFVATASYYRPTATALPPGTDRATDCLNRIYRDEVAAAPPASIIDLAQYVCPNGSCRIEQDGTVLRPDGLHFEGPSAVWASTWLLQQLWAASFEH